MEEKNELIKKEGNSINSLLESVESNMKMFTNITDPKKIFNLESNVDYLLNDCEGENLRIKEVMIRIFEKELKDPVINQETGEIEKTNELSMSCILIDDNDKSYATGSKMFIRHLMKFIQIFGENKLKEGFEIKIVKKKMPDSNNKYLYFELI